MQRSGLFGLTEHLERPSRHGDPLEVLDATVDFAFFRPWLVEASATATAPRADGHRSTRSRCSRR